jgi:hypothetical protein
MSLSYGDCDRSTLISVSGMSAPFGEDRGISSAFAQRREYRRNCGQLGNTSFAVDSRFRRFFEWTPRKNAAQDRATCDGNDPGSGSFREPVPSASPAHAVIEAAGYALFPVGQDGRMRWATPMRPVCWPD